MIQLDQNNTLWVKKTGPLFIWTNFGKYCPILIILLLSQLCQNVVSLGS